MEKTIAKEKMLLPMKDYPKGWKYALCFCCILYFGVEVYSWLLLETDSFVTRLFASGFGDTMSWAHSARVKFIHGVWYRPNMDDWRPIFIVPFHETLTWLGYELFGLTLTGHRFFPFILVHLAKLLVLYVVWKECGTKILVFCLIVLSVYAPFNELARIGSVDSIQTGLYLLAAVSLYFAESESKPKKLLYIATGVFTALAVLYKISGIVFLAFPFAYILFTSNYRDILNELRQFSSRIYCYVLGICLIIIPYMFFWQIPFLDESIYFSWRMFGRGAGVVSPTDFSLLWSHIINFLSSKHFNEHIVSYHAFWIFGIIAYLMLISFVPVTRRKVIDYVLLSVFTVFFIQIIFFDMAFRRYIGLIPFAVIALFRLANLLYDVKTELKYPTVPNILLFFFSVFLFVQALSNVFDHQIILTILLLGTLISIISYLYCKAIGRPIVLSLLLVVGLYFLPAQAFYTYQYFTKQDTSLREVSIELGKKMGNARVIEAHWTGLYNETENEYHGSHSGQFKPDGWVYDQIKKQDMREFASQEYKTNFWALQLKILESFYPGFFDRWYLPPNYIERYRSDLFAFYNRGDDYNTYLYNHYAKRHLFLGMNDENVYVHEATRFADWEGNEVLLDYVEEKNITLVVPDFLVNRHWYGLNENRKKEITFKFKRHDKE